MRNVLLIMVIMLTGCEACLAQVSTMGSTAMGLSSTPGTIVTSPLNGPSPFSATTQPDTPDTTLAPVPLASDPTTPGTVLNCSTPTGQIAPGTPAVPLTSTSSMPLTIGTTPSVSPAPTIPTVTATVSSTPLGTIPTVFVGSSTGTISPVSPLGSSSITVCSSTPGGPPTNGAALPLSTPQVPNSPPPGTIQPDITQLATTSIAPTMAVMPTPNTSACAESVTMDLATPSTMAPANATGAAATPGVSPASPSGC